MGLEGIGIQMWLEQVEGRLVAEVVIDVAGLRNGRQLGQEKEELALACQGSLLRREGLAGRGEATLLVL